jgi:hypothetical protein
MDHVLAKLRGVRVEDIGKILKADAAQHAEQGLRLEHLWQNADDPDEALFLFQADDLDRARQFIETVHAQARRQDPNANLPQMTFLRGSEAR